MNGYSAMRPPSPLKLSDETRRIAVLDDYRVLDTPPEAEFDRIVQLAANLFGVPIALVSLVHAERQFFKARIGLKVCETSREVSFCAHALASYEVLVVPDALADPRFADNPLVTGEPFIRFYAGVPIVSPEGHKLGTVCVIDTVARSPLTDQQEKLLQSLAQIAMDQLERRRLDIVRRAAMRMAAATPDAIVCADETGAVSFWNAAAERMFGFSRSEMMGWPLSSVVPPRDRGTFDAIVAHCDGAGGRAGRTLEITGVRHDGTEFPIELSLAIWSDGDHLQFGCIMRDLSERNQTQDRVRYLTQFDRLTNLPNRSRFLEMIDDALTAARPFAVLKIGLDRFKTVNGTLGMAAGDVVLVAAAQRVIDVAGIETAVARLGADEFGILALGTDNPITAGTLAGKVIARLGHPFQVGSSLCRLGASIGIVLSPGLAKFDAADAVLKGALLALQRAKAAGGRRYECFQPQMMQQAEERQQAEEDLRRALAENAFELHYQPQVTIADGRMFGAEALLRWRHPERGLLSPGSFLPALEMSDLVLDVGRWIMARACAFAADMSRRGNPIRIGVNLFAAHLADPGFFDDVVTALKTTGLPADRLELEITETTVLGLEESVIEPLRLLKKLGVGIAFDDYGTGFASLSLLKRYPLTRLKIDREFVRDLGSDRDDAAIVKAVVALGASLGLDVIAEGIETPEQASALVEFGCWEAQGYFFGRPMPEAQFVSLYLQQDGPAQRRNCKNIRRA